MEMKNKEIENSDITNENTNNEEEHYNEIHYDKIKQYVDTRCVYPPETMHRIYEYKMHDISYTVIRLPVHEENISKMFILQKLMKKRY